MPEIPSSDRPSSARDGGSPGAGPDRLLTPGEVAELFRVNPKTVTRWARAGKLSAIRTLGGHRRFRASEVSRFLDQLSAEAPPRP